MRRFVESLSERHQLRDRRSGTGMHPSAHSEGSGHVKTPRSRGPVGAELLSALALDRIVLEATGGYERLAVAELAAARLPVVVVNPVHLTRQGSSDLSWLG